MSKHLQILIADDEAPARRRIRQMLEKLDLAFDHEEAKDGLEAIEFIKNRTFDLVLLDIQMPRYTGIEVVQEVGIEAMPPVIFITAYDDFAVQAFEVNALDYIMKPFDFPRFRQSLDRLFTQAERGSQQHALAAAVATFPSPKQYPTHLWVNKNGSYLPLPVQEIPAFGIDGNYANCHWNGKTYLLRESLQHLEETLDPGFFRRTHRSWLVNLHHIKAVHSKSHGDCIIELHSGQTIPMSRRYRKNLIG